MHKYKHLFIDDKVKIVKSADPFTRNITTELIGEVGVIVGTEHVPGATPNYYVYTDALKTNLFLRRDALVYYGRDIPFDPLHRVLPNGETILAVAKDNKSIVHTIHGYSIFPLCGARIQQSLYATNLSLAPKITCQRCLAIMYHKRRALIESLKQGR